MVGAPAEASDPEQIAGVLNEYLAREPSAVLLESGRILFDLRLAQIKIAAEHGRCVLHVWSEDRNLIRHVVEAIPRKTGLRLKVLRMGQSKPHTLELQPQYRRLPSERDAARTRFLALLERTLPRHFPEAKIEGLRTAMDLERSFGPAYARGLLVQGRSAWAVIAINSDESQALVDGILTLGMLWLEHCRKGSGSRRVVEGLRLILPRGRSETTAARLAWMHPRAARWELYEFDEKAEELRQRDPADCGNLESRLVHAPNLAAAEERFGPAIERVRALLPTFAAAEMEIVFRSGTQVGLLWNGLEFARIQTAFAENSFARSEEILFGAGAQAVALTEETAPRLRELVTELVHRRRANGNKRDKLYRQQPERWLESLLRRTPGILDAGIESHPIYAQVPAFSTADRAVLDLLAVRRDGRLAVIEIKADEDLHLAMQSLDYWARVRKHLQSCCEISSQDRRNDLERFGYFPGKQLRRDAPLLYLVAPALRIHPATEVVLRYLPPEVEWSLVALDERWREKLRVVFRKRAVG